jgi:hypothetical protein
MSQQRQPLRLPFAPLGRKKAARTNTFVNSGNEMNSDYASFLRSAATTERTVIQRFKNEMPRKWCVAYDQMTASRNNIVEVTLGTYDYLFDLASLIPNNKIEDRLVVVYGTTSPNLGPRDAARMKGWMGSHFKDRHGRPMDKGHGMSHRSGGGLDINLFPQRPEVNRGFGSCEHDLRFREMERQAVKRPGTFCFLRFIYRDSTWFPSKIEYGLIRADGTLNVEEFDN